MIETSEYLNWDPLAIDSKYNPSLRSLKADSSKGVYYISWNNADSYIEYELYLDDIFITSNTSLVGIKREAQEHCES